MAELSDTDELKAIAQTLSEAQEKLNAAHQHFIAWWQRQIAAVSSMQTRVQMAAARIDALDSASPEIMPDNVMPNQESPHDVAERE